MEAVFAVFVMVALFGALVFYMYANWRWYTNNSSGRVSFLGQIVSPAVMALFWANVALLSVGFFCAIVRSLGSLPLTQSAGLVGAVFIGLSARRLMADAVNPKAPAR